MKSRVLGPAALAALAVFLVPAAARATRPPAVPLEPIPGEHWETDPWRPDADLPTRAYVSPTDTYDETVTQSTVAVRRESWFHTLMRFLRHWFVYGGGAR
jgi:hypothetical protein